jgi:hypothetical protein
MYAIASVINLKTMPLSADSRSWEWIGLTVRRMGSVFSFTVYRPAFLS